MKALVFLLLCFGAIGVFGQGTSFRRGNDLTDSINRLIYAIDSTENKIAGSKLLELDTVTVTYYKLPHKIETVNTFKKSGSKLLVDYYFTGKLLLCIRIKEISPIISDKYTATVYYYRNDSLVYTDYFSTVRPCMAISFDYDQYGYNPAFTADFIAKYCKNLFAKIKKTN